MNARTVIRRLGGSAKLARKLGLDNAGGATTVRAWRYRDSIPADWFTAIVEVARSEGEPEITADALAKDAAERKRRSVAAYAEARVEA